MLERPSLSDEAIQVHLRDCYGLPLEGITFLPLGEDNASWAYRLQAQDGAGYFLKVRSGELNLPSLLVPRYLQAHGARQVIAPLAAVDGSVWTDLGGYHLILYPFLEGESAAQAGMPDHHWITYGAVLRMIHDTSLPPEILPQMRRETYTPGWIEWVKRWNACIAVQGFSDPNQDRLASFWRVQQATICAVVERAETLGRQLQAADLPLVLCHADIHTHNLLLEPSGRLWLVDWDEVVLAPRERDLMFVVGGISSKLVSPRDEALFFIGYGQVEVNPLALAYYRCAWAVQDIGGFAERAFEMPELGEVSKRHAADLFMSLFEPGEIVALALNSDDKKIV